MEWNKVYMYVHNSDSDLTINFWWATYPALLSVLGVFTNMTSFPVKLSNWSGQFNLHSLLWCWLYEFTHLLASAAASKVILLHTKFHVVHCLQNCYCKVHDSTILESINYYKVRIMSVQKQSLWVRVHTLACKCSSNNIITPTLKWFKGFSNDIQTPQRRAESLTND